MILQSGSALSSWAVDEEPVKSAMIMAEILKCKSKEIKEVVKCFKEAEVDDLINAHVEFEVSFIFLIKYKIQNLKIFDF